jgi:trk system potassium uptake protein TrkA
MKIIIFGAGRVGTQLAKRLISDENEVVLLESDPSVAKRAGSQLDCLVINEQGNNRESLENAGLRTADYFVSLTGSDELNIIACGLAKSEYPEIKTVARIRNLEYSSSKLFDNPLMGIDYMINPEIEVAEVITIALKKGVMGNILNFPNTDIEVRTYLAGESFRHLGKSLSQLREDIGRDFLIPVIDRGANYIIPSGDTPILEGDHLYVMAKQEVFPSLFPENRNVNSFQKVLIVGGGRVGQHVANNLIDRNQGGFFSKLYKKLQGKGAPKIDFIEMNYGRCKELTEQYPDSTVIHADISDDGILDQGSFGEPDLMLTVTGNQELNMIAAMYGKRRGIARAVTLVQKSSYEGVARDLGIDMAYSTNATMVNKIFSIIRQESVRSVHAISGGALELVEFDVGEDSAIKGKMIKNLKLPEQSLVLLVLREGEGIFPAASTTIRVGDRTIMLCPSQNLKKMEELF